MLKDLWHFNRVSAYFSDASQNFPMHKISLVSFWIGRLMYSERIKVIIRQTPTTKQEMLPKKGVGVAKFDSKTFRNQLFSRVKGCHIINTWLHIHSGRILKSKIMSILMIIFVVVFLSDLVRNILKCNCSPHSTLMTMFLPDAILWSNVL